VSCAVIVGAFIVLELIGAVLSSTAWGRQHDKVLAWLPLSYAAVWVPIAAIVGVIAAIKMFKRVCRRYTQPTSNILDQTA
jgi:hypothetical protein